MPAWKCSGCGTRLSAYHNLDCPEIAAGPRNQESPAERAKRLPLAGKRADMLIVDDPQAPEPQRAAVEAHFREIYQDDLIRYLPSRIHMEDKPGDLSAGPMVAMDIPTHYDPTERGTFAAIDLASGPDRMAGIRINADGTSTFLTDTELAAEFRHDTALVAGKPLPAKTARDRMMDAVKLAQRNFLDSDMNHTCLHCGTVRGHKSNCIWSHELQDRPIPPKAARDRQMLALIGAEGCGIPALTATEAASRQAEQARLTADLLAAPAMVVNPDGSCRPGTEMERKLADENSLLKCAADEWLNLANWYSKTLQDTRATLHAAEVEIATLKAAAVSRETPAASKSEVMGRAIGATLAGWKPVV
jgi:hypothetical protein